MYVLYGVLESPGCVKPGNRTERNGREKNTERARSAHEYLTSMGSRRREDPSREQRAQYYTLYRVESVAREIETQYAASCTARGVEI